MRTAQSRSASSAASDHHTVVDRPTPPLGCSTAMVTGSETREQETPFETVSVVVDTALKIPGSLWARCFSRVTVAVVRSENAQQPQDQINHHDGDDEPNKSVWPM
jgi:hypothetical protein